MTIIGKSICVVFLAFALSGPTLAADDYDQATRKAIQDVIAQQLDALAHEDAAKAETFAASAIRKRFPEPKQFFDMVKNNYGALIHPKRTHFDDTAKSPHGPLQKVTIVAADGTVWTAIYSLEQADGSWRITGCGLEKLAGQQDI